MKAVKFSLAALVVRGASQEDHFSMLQHNQGVKGIDAGTRLIASKTTQQGPCDIDCVKSAAAFQGADALIASQNLKYWMDVEYKASETAGDACGMGHSFAAVSPFFVNPSAPTKVTTAETREEPVVTFQCTEGKWYHLIMHDSLNGAIDNVRGFTHWVKLNLKCNASTSTGTTVGSGTDMTQSSGAVGYLHPAFPYSEFNHFHFVLFETDNAFGAKQLADFNAHMMANNVLGGHAPSIPLHMEQLGLKHLPVARSWIDVTTSFFSKVGIDRLLPPGLVVEGFSDVQCKCNTYGNEADTQCVLSYPTQVRSEGEIQKKCSSERRKSDRRACLLRWGIF